MIRNEITLIKDYGLNFAKEILSKSQNCELYLDRHVDVICHMMQVAPRPNVKTGYVCRRDALEQLIANIELIDSLGGLHNALDLRYWKEACYVENAERIDTAIKALRNWFSVGDLVVLKNGEDRVTRTITGLYRDGCLLECIDGVAYSIGCMRHATLEESEVRYITKEKIEYKWSELRSLRSAYAHGIRTPETLEACRKYKAWWRLKTKNKLQGATP